MNRLASPAQLRASFLRWSLLTVPAILLLGRLSSLAAGSTAEDPWFLALDKPTIFPPPITFGIVWTILYVMMGLALALVCTSWGARFRGPAIAAFILQLAINLAWTPVFFAAHEIKAALAVIAVLDLAVLITVVLFWKVRRTAGLLLLPYLTWVLFATVLNYEFMRLNPDADGQEGSFAVQRVAL